MGKGIRNDYKRLGPTRAGSLWVHKGIYWSHRRHIVGDKEDILEASHWEDCGYIGASETSNGHRREGRPSIVLDKLCCTYNPHVGAGALVEPAQSDAKRLDQLGEDGRREHGGVGSEELTSTLVDGLINSNKSALWSPNTRNKYKRTLNRFVSWCIAREETNVDNSRKNENANREQCLDWTNQHSDELLARYIQPYLESLVGHTTGENIYVVGSTLLRTLGMHLPDGALEDLKLSIKILRQRANCLNPPLQQPADAVCVSDLRRLVRGAERGDMSHIERQAVEVLTIAFATTSRVAEICALKTRDVAKSGAAILIRAKTFATTCQRHLKRVADGCGLWPSNILVKRRERALLEGRELLFSALEGEDLQLSSSTVTAALKRACRKANIECRITSHSGRKGAAVSALMAGIPIVVIQSLGLWASVDTLQSYLGKAVREKFGVLELISGFERLREANDEQVVGVHHRKPPSC